jgi:hypothetical protein
MIDPKLIGAQKEVESSGMAELPTVAGRASAVPLAEKFPRPFGRYELRSLLGRGGMGSVFLAYDPSLDRLVALKVPRPFSDEMSNWRERFLVEARTAATLHHPNICPVFEVGEVDSQPYLTMAFVEGETLAKRLKRGGLTIAESTGFATIIARAMGEAHQRGIVHRDLKPANIMLDHRGQPVIMDFGLAHRVMANDDLRLTLSGVAMGTPAYMPPEQAGGDLSLIGPWSDVYALGVILNEMLTGQTPFQGKTFGKLLAQIERDPPPNPSTLNPEVDAALASIVLHALEKEPADRFPTATELASALERYGQGDRTVVASRSRALSNEQPTATYAPRAAGGNGSRWPAIALMAAALPLLIALAVTIYVTTNFGTLVVQLSDPAAEVKVSVDGKVVMLDAEGRSVSIRAGENHKLEITGPGYETIGESFDLKRGDTHVARITLKPLPPPAEQRSPEKSPPDVSEKKPEKSPEKVRVDPPLEQLTIRMPEQATSVETGPWRILVGADRSAMQTWLDDRQRDGNTVQWLDACQFNNETLFSAAAWTKGSGPAWFPLLDVTFEEVNDVKRLAKRVDGNKFSLRTMSPYRRDNKIFAAMLFIEASEPNSELGIVTKPNVDIVLAHNRDTGFWPKSIRPLAVGRRPTWYALYQELGEGEARYGLGQDAEEFANLIATCRTDGLRPLAVTPYPFDGQLKFATTIDDTPTAAGESWEVDTDTAIGDLSAKAERMATQGMQPFSISLYGWNGEVRCSTVWLKPGASKPDDGQ